MQTLSLYSLFSVTIDDDDNFKQSSSFIFDSCVAVVVVYVNCFASLFKYFSAKYFNAHKAASFCESNDVLASPVRGLSSSDNIEILT